MPYIKPEDVPNKDNKELLDRAIELKVILGLAIAGESIGGDVSTTRSKDDDGIKATTKRTFKFDFGNADLGFRELLEDNILPEAITIWDASKERGGFQATIEQIWEGPVLQAVKEGKFPSLPEKNDLVPPSVGQVIPLLPGPKKK